MPIDECEQTLNQLLSEMDGFAANTGVILLSATNRPEVLDPALLRPGRFDSAKRRLRQRQIVVDRPDKLGRQAILVVHARNVKMADDVDLLKLAARTPGSGSIEKISIVPRGVAALGYTLQLPQEDRFLMVEDELRGQIAMLLGGRSAEELIMGKVSTGASDDIQKATDLAVGEASALRNRYVTIYGMSKQLGPMAFDRSASQFLGGWGNPRRPLSPEVESEIDYLR